MRGVEEIVRLGKLVLQFGRVDRITYHEDGVTPESDTDHTVMLGVIACAFAEQHFPWLNLGRIAEFALVHDLVEVYAGDTPTLRISDEGRTDKAMREARALERIGKEFPHFPWLRSKMRTYERCLLPEARYVKAMDKLLPKITHILNQGTTLIETNVSTEELVALYDKQFFDMQVYAEEFHDLFLLRQELIGMLVEIYKEGAPSMTFQVGDEVRWVGVVGDTEHWFCARLMEEAPENYREGWAVEITEQGTLYSPTYWSCPVGMRVYVRETNCHIISRSSHES